MSISYITNEAGEKTAVIVPIEEWNKLNPTAESIQERLKTARPIDLSGLRGAWRERTEDPVAAIRAMREEREIGWWNPARFPETFKAIN